MCEATKTDVAVERLDVSVYMVPTETEESDGTLEWDSTTMILVEASGGATWLAKEERLPDPLPRSRSRTSATGSASS